MCRSGGVRERSQTGQQMLGNLLSVRPWSAGCCASGRAREPVYRMEDRNKVEPIDRRELDAQLPREVRAGCDARQIR